MAKKTRFLCKAREIMRCWKKSAFCVKSLLQTHFVRVPPIEKHAGMVLACTICRRATVFLRSKKAICFHRRHHGNELRMTFSNGACTTGERVNPPLACVHADSLRLLITKLLRPVQTLAFDCVALRSESESPAHLCFE
ncbi:hypothetical protein IscW_ISCW007257 [Ixodes scapularis]|uniref:Uncharacterized protein n=1 Tax=Ixodes scapularis TaxID=6945 RepID=B7PVH0_IXOSC|nr:hypothetical protein IscW_ISCW007257 [Ixodes scapularis]|eukprot:XP_002407927.1 hypothetical protein IscW_ISCW007257 [Ixodes scapularis]